MTETILSITVLSLLAALLYERKRHMKREGELLNLCLRASGLSAISVDTSVDPSPLLPAEEPKEFRERLRFSMPATLLPVPPLHETKAAGK